MEDHGIAKLHTLTALTSLGLAGCVALTARALGHVSASMPALASLKLGGCSRVATVTDACLVHLQQLTAMTHLDLSGCLEISDSGDLGSTLFLSLASELVWRVAPYAATSPWLVCFCYL